MRQTAVTPVVLGLLSLGPRSGYDIKTVVDRSTRHFWAASYGQIYPELRRLEQEGLVRSQAEPSGGRARTAYDLTDQGEEALRVWLSSEEAGYELRDEGMLKLFFSDLAPETAALLWPVRSGPAWPSGCGPTTRGILPPRAFRPPTASRPPRGGKSTPGSSAS